MSQYKAVETPYGSSPALRRLEALRPHELEGVLLRGSRPDPAALEGWQFRGTNTPGWAKVLGIKKFIKGFWSEQGQLMGYNCPVEQNALFEPWIAKPSDATPKRFGFYKVVEVDPTSRDNAYLHALLLDYGQGPNPPWEPARVLRDYLVQVSPENPDLYLGKAIVALGRARLATNFFVLERDRRAP